MPSFWCNTVCSLFILFILLLYSCNEPISTEIPAVSSSWVKSTLWPYRSKDRTHFPISPLHLTSFPLCWAERVSLRAKTFPQTEISLQTPGAGSETNSPAGCITSTPLVVRPSIKPSDVLHLAARSWETTTHAHAQTHTKQADVKVRGMMRRHRGMIVEVDVRGGWLEKQPTLLFSAAIFSSVQNDYYWLMHRDAPTPKNKPIPERKKGCIMNTN